MNWLSLLKKAFNSWSEDKALRLSAALAYYSIFSIAPLLVITMGIAGLVLDQKAATGELFDQLKGYVGPKAAQGLQSMVESAAKPTSGVVATIVGAVTLLFGASGVMGELKDALNTIWEVKPKPGSAFWGLIHEKFLNFGMVIVIGFLLMVSLLLSAAVATLSKRFETFLALPPAVWAVVAFLISFAVVTVMIAMIFKVLPDAKIQWRDVWFGAAITALLFEIGKTALGWYLGLESTASAYGAAGSVVLLLLWVYYASCILFFGAEFTQVYAEAKGHFITPDSDAEPVTASDRSEQGLPAPKEDRPAVIYEPSQKPLFRHRLIEPLLKYLEGRGLLVSVEAKEALQQAITFLIIASVMLITLFAGWLLLATALVGALTGWLGWNWVSAAAAAGGLHVVVAAALGLLGWLKFGRTTWFAETFKELKNDRLWLKGQATKS